VEPYLPLPILLHVVYKDNFPDKVISIECNSVLDRVLLFLNHISYHSVIAYNTFSHRTNISVVNLKNFIFGRASDLYLCLNNQLFALFHYVFKFLTPCNFKNNHFG